VKPDRGIQLPLATIDTPLADGSVISGQNFREVAPEVLSPLAWSMIGAGMDAGFRRVLAAFGIRSDARRPVCTAYVGFRPFHQIDVVERLIARMPGLSREDCWEFLLGGPPPPTSSEREVSWVTKASALGPELRVLLRSRRWYGETSALVFDAEARVDEAVRSGSPFAAATAFTAAVEAAQAAWALHMVTTCCAVGGAGLLRRGLSRVHGSGGEELFRSILRRGGTTAGVVIAVDASSSDPRCLSYEVADATESFAPWSRNAAVAAASEQDAVGIGELLPQGSLLDDQLHALSRFASTLLSEREASKALGLRALHCVRRLIDQEIHGLPADDAGFLAVSELERVASPDQRALVDDRREELSRCAELAVPVDFEVRGGRAHPLRRRASRRGDALEGIALAPGWAEGRAASSETFEPGDVLCGVSVEAHEVLALQPVGVVTELGSMLSHVGIVCREFGIPVVAGVSLDALGADVQVDGWSGRVIVQS
jgi:phosphohistidine swiveling domain-containing protein